MSSIKSLRKSLSADSEILSATRKERSVLLSQKKMKDLTQVVRAFVAAENFFLSRFAGIHGLQYVHFPRALRDQYVQEGLPKELANLGLQDRQWKMALEVAFGNIKSSHIKTQDELRATLSHAQSLNEKEKHLIRYLLLRAPLLYFICLGKFKKAESLVLLESQSSKFSSPLREAIQGHEEKIKVNLSKVFRWLRRKYRELHSRHQKPIVRKMRTYHVDANMFTFFREKERNYISVASLKPRQRIAIPLSNSSLLAEDFAGTMKIVLRKDGKIEVHRTINQIIKKCPISPEQVIQDPSDLKITAIDKGLKSLIHTDDQAIYGSGYSEKFKKWSDELNEMNAGRARFRSLIRVLEQDRQKTQNPKARQRLKNKIRRIQENNLGDLKASKKREFVQLEIRKEIGTAVNALYKKETPHVLITENLRFISFKSLGKRINRLLNNWSKGALRDALEQGAKKNGVLLEEINAAYSSQCCRICFFVSRKNREADKFDCAFCGHKENADFAAAKNVRDRFFDSEIGVFTPVREVKKILLERHRVRLSTLDLNVVS